MHVVSFLSVSLCFYISEMELAAFKTAVPTVPNFEGSDNTESDSDCADSKSPEVNCVKCTTNLCQLSDIRKYMHSNHLVLKNDFHEKVQLTPHRPKAWSDGK